MKIALLSITLLFVLMSIGGIGFYFLGYASPPPLISDLIKRSSTIPDPQPSTNVPVVYGYLPYWNRSTAQFSPSLTHVSFFSLEIQGDGHIIEIPSKSKDQGYRLFSKGVLTNLKTEIGSTQKLELTLSMLDQDAIPLFMASRSAQQTAVADIDELIRTQPIDGINIDVEYNGEVTKELQTQFAVFLSDIENVVKKTTPQKHLSIALYADAASIPRLADPALVAPHVDHLIIMAYDFHRRSSPKSGPVAPLFGGNEKKWESDIVQTLKGYTSVVPSQKILLGIPFYGYEWSVTGTDPQSFTLPKSGSTATYQRVKKLIATGKATVKWDDTALSPYLLYEEDGAQQLIYFEDAQSLRYKLDLVKQSGLGGIAIWALGYEGGSQELWETIQSSL